MAVADPEKQTTLNSEVVPDPLDEDQPEIDTDTDIKQLMMENGIYLLIIRYQTWQIVHDELIAEQAKRTRHVPKGTSDYQAAWIEDEEEGSDVGDEEDEHWENECEDMEEEDDMTHNGADDEDNAMSVAQMDDEDEDAATGVTFDTNEADMHKEERENRQWPDEVEIPRDTTARERFQKYRGLKSFR